MSDLEKRYEVISKINWGAVVVMYLSEKVQLTQKDIKELVYKVLEFNWKIGGTWDSIIMEIKINEYILQ